MCPLPTLSINHQTLTVLENRLQNPDNQMIRKDKTTSNCKQLLLASGATPIGSTTVPPMIKRHRHESSHQLGDMVESMGIFFNRQTRTAKVRRTQLGRTRLKSSSTRRSRRRCTRNYTGSRNNKSCRRPRLASGSRVALKMLGCHPRTSCPQ